MIRFHKRQAEKQQPDVYVPRKIISYYCAALLFLSSFFLPVANASIYADISAAQINIKTSAATTKPAVLDLRLGYSLNKHQIELSVMSGIKDATLNQLTTSIPSITSIFYHFIPYPDDRLKLHLILGASQTTVDSSYINTADSSDLFTGVAVGIGLEEYFKLLPQLKLKAEILRLYSGNDLDINAFTFGVRYDF